MDEISNKYSKITSTKWENIKKMDSFKSISKQDQITQEVAQKIFLSKNEVGEEFRNIAKERHNKISLYRLVLILSPKWYIKIFSGRSKQIFSEIIKGAKTELQKEQIKNLENKFDQRIQKYIKISSSTKNNFTVNVADKEFTINEDPNTSSLDEIKKEGNKEYIKARVLSEESGIKGEKDWEKRFEATFGEITKDLSEENQLKEKIEEFFLSGSLEKYESILSQLSLKSEDFVKQLLTDESTITTIEESETRIQEKLKNLVNERKKATQENVSKLQKSESQLNRELQDLDGNIKVTAKSILDLSDKIKTEKKNEQKKEFISLKNDFEKKLEQQSNNYNRKKIDELHPNLKTQKEEKEKLSNLDKTLGDLELLSGKLNNQQQKLFDHLKNSLFKDSNLDASTARLFQQRMLSYCQSLENIDENQSSQHLQTMFDQLRKSYIAKELNVDKNQIHDTFDLDTVHQYIPISENNLKAFLVDFWVRETHEDLLGSRENYETQLNNIKSKNYNKRTTFIDPATTKLFVIDPFIRDNKNITSDTYPAIRKEIEEKERKRFKQMVNLPTQKDALKSTLQPVKNVFSHLYQGSPTPPEVQETEKTATTGAMTLTFDQEVQSTSTDHFQNLAWKAFFEKLESTTISLPLTTIKLLNDDCNKDAFENDFKKILKDSLFSIPKEQKLSYTKATGQMPITTSDNKTVNVHETQTKISSENKDSGLVSIYLNKDSKVPFLKLTNVMYSEYYDEYTFEGEFNDQEFDKFFELALGEKITKSYLNSTAISFAKRTMKEKIKETIKKEILETFRLSLEEMKQLFGDLNSEPVFPK